MRVFAYSCSYVLILFFFHQFFSYVLVIVV